MNCNAIEAVMNGVSFLVEGAPESAVGAIASAMDKISTLAKEPLEYVGLGPGFPGVHGDTVFVTWIIIAVCGIAAFLIGRRLEVVPGVVQSALEAVYSFFEELAEGTGGERVKKYVPFVISFFFFITISNLWGLVPPLQISVGGESFSMFMPPTRDVNTTLALAILSFLTFQVIGFKEGGIRYLLHYFHPLGSILPGFSKPLQAVLIVPLSIFFLMINIIEEVARVMSLTMRLMGNILGEHIVSGILVGLVFIAAALAPNAFLGWGFAAGADMFAFVMQFMGVLTGVVQGFVFTLLTLSYIGLAVNFED